MLEQIKAGTVSIRRAVIDKIVTPEDFLEGPLKEWATDFKAHVTKSETFLSQIALIKDESNQKFVNFRPHLQNVIFSCSDKIQGANIDAFNYNFTQEYIEAQVSQPSLDKKSPDYKRAVSLTVLKSLELMEQVKVQDITAVKNAFFRVGDETIHNDRVMDYMTERLNASIVAVDAMDDQKKKDELTNAARLFSAKLYHPTDFLYRQNFCFCLKLLMHGNEAIGGLASDQSVAMLLGSAAFIDVYPLLKEPGMTKIFADTLAELGVGDNVAYHVGTACKVTFKSFCKYMNKKTMILLAGGLALFKFFPDPLGEAQKFGHALVEGLHQSTQKPTDFF